MVQDAAVESILVKKRCNQQSSCASHCYRAITERSTSGMKAERVAGVVRFGRLPRVGVLQLDAGASAGRQRLLRCDLSADSPRLAPKTVEMGDITDRFARRWPVPTNGTAHRHYAAGSDTCRQAQYAASCSHAPER